MLRLLHLKPKLCFICPPLAADHVTDLDVTGIASSKSGYIFYEVMNGALPAELTSGQINC